MQLSPYYLINLETIAKKEVEDVMPIATGHEKEELEAELEVIPCVFFLCMSMCMCILSLHDYLFKLSLIGDSGVGKSCLLLRWSQGHKKKQSM
ncbi:BnaC06g23280D [Brassica napus]|uniref:BnaC06g23280D protein n=2 Tax=Brassica TaxID=3705 RepID=A0A078FCN1_BRANA|nr:BnaC06g23280D [Brassica napus]